RDVSDLVFLLFQLFWVIGWSVGVLFLGGLTVLLFLYGESARLENGQLVYVPHLGPLKIILDYDLSRVRNVRLENAGTGGNDGTVRLGCVSGQAPTTRGDTRPRGGAGRRRRRIRGARGNAGVRAVPGVPREVRQRPDATGPDAPSQEPAA